MTALLDVGESLGPVRGNDAHAALWYAWVGRHAGDVDRLTRDLLSGEERARTTSYRSREAAERYVVTRALVRLVLGRQLSRDPRDVELTRTDTGKPIVSGGVHFSISHSGDLILMAVSRSGDVGVDVERRREVPRVESLTARWLTEDERREVARLTETTRDRSDAFLRVWTLKEARLKALGVGISGAGTAEQALKRLVAIPLDNLLSGCVDHAGRGYVGAIAFA